MREINMIILHCSGTLPLARVTTESIRRYHVEDRGWKDIGYHYVITTDGKLHDGRPIDEIGAHVKGHNTGSIGICLVGGVKNEDGVKFYDVEFDTLRILIKDLFKRFGKLPVYGHSDFTTLKDCPSFNVKEFMKTVE